jgi:hypothetical protein
MVVEDAVHPAVTISTKDRPNALWSWKQKGSQGIGQAPAEKEKKKRL